ncbi:MafI family immunity protein [Herbaspirillum autotrophicum]|uniref:MafI family immunity protein n=1 Tax=Herbaspirillum autotrophicum TaxID=180195 RepID=UPI000A8BE431|nr:MafI family immunity protein [Herbaspirillum autotrophicum]
MFAEKIKEFADRISGKLDDDLLQGALNYADHNEEPLAIEILCDHLIEYEVDLSQEDLSLLKSILVEMKINISATPFKYFDFP